jgi:hypothetical protein
MAQGEGLTNQNGQATSASPMMLDYSMSATLLPHAFAKAIADIFPLNFEVRHFFPISENGARTVKV